MVCLLPLGPGLFTELRSSSSCFLNCVDRCCGWNWSERVNWKLCHTSVLVDYCTNVTVLSTNSKMLVFNVVAPRKNLRFGHGLYRIYMHIPVISTTSVSLLCSFGFSTWSEINQTFLGSKTVGNQPVHAEYRAAQNALGVDIGTRAAEAHPMGKQTSS